MDLCLFLEVDEVKGCYSPVTVQHGQTKPVSKEKQNWKLSLLSSIV